MKIRLTCLCLALGILLSACGTPKGDLTPATATQPAASQEEPLMAAVETQEEAEELAELYGITLVSFSYGIATFYTEEDLCDVIQRGEKNGWTLLSINGSQTAY